MPRVTFVKKARKAIPQYDIAVGDSYYHWAFMVGGRGGPKICSKTRPTRSQLTRSDYFGAIYGLYDGGDLRAIEEGDPADAVDALKEFAERVREIGQEQQEKFDNMPDGLQQGDTGQMIEERVSNCESVADEIDSTADELETKLGEIDSEEEEHNKAVEAWKAYEAARDAWDEDSGEDEPEEPEDGEPEEKDFDQDRKDAVSEAISEIGEPE